MPDSSTDSDGASDPPESAVRGVAYDAAPELLE
jgi:hypothetical protein